MKTAIRVKKRVVYVDFGLFDQSDFKKAPVFYRRFCTWITKKLKLKDQVEGRWEKRLGSNLNCTNYMEEYLLPAVDGPLLLALDKVERLFKTDYCSDFFGMLRSWHNSREIDSVWNQLDLVFVSSTEPHHFITDPDQSPFNVGLKIEFEDFTEEQVVELNRRHNEPLTLAEVQQLINLVGGHPYLVRKALYLVASGRRTASDLLAHATDEGGPFSDHLRYYLFQLLRGPKDLIEGLRQVLGENKKCQDEMVCFYLEGTGLVRNEGTLYRPRCQLYADYFREHLHV